LLVFYQDRFAVEGDSSILQKLLVIGDELDSQRLREFTTDALGTTIDILRPDEVGLNLPVSNLKFDDIAAPAGIATLGWK